MSLEAGSLLGKYRIEELLGEGGMGVVYLATDTTLSRPVALKLLPADWMHHQERRSRFEREAKILGSLNHPGIATLYGLEDAGGHAFLAMEWVDGVTLNHYFRKPPSVAQVLRLYLTVAEALGAAHAKGVVHRDLKPGNVMVTADGAVKLLDFGLAKAAAAALPAGDPDETSTLYADATRPGQVMGTAGYMSPEQTRGLATDERTDIWAFGCCLFETLSNKRAFRGITEMDTQAQILRDDPDWDSLPPELPAAIGNLLRRCLQKDADQRLHSIADARIVIAECLRDLETGTTTVPGTLGRTALRVRRSWRRAPWKPAAAIVVGALLLWLGWRSFAPSVESGDAATAAPQVVRFPCRSPARSTCRT